MALLSLSCFKNIYLAGATQEISCWPQVTASHGSVPRCDFKIPQATFEYNSCLKFQASNLIVLTVDRRFSLCDPFASFMVTSRILGGQKRPIQALATIEEVKLSWFKCLLCSGLISCGCRHLSLTRESLITSCAGTKSLCFWQVSKNGTEAFPDDRHRARIGGNLVTAWLMRKATGLQNKKGRMMSSV